MEYGFAAHTEYPPFLGKQPERVGRWNKSGSEAVLFSSIIALQLSF